MNKSRKKKVKETLKMKSCRYCRSKENLTIDHKVPITQGGKDDISNLQCLCKRCNGIKSGLSHNQVIHYWRWFTTIQKEREMNGKKPYHWKDTNQMTDTNRIHSSDEFPQGMTFTREPIENPLAVSCGKGTMYPITCNCKGKFHEDDCANRKVEDTPYDQSYDELKENSVVFK